MSNPDTLPLRQEVIPSDPELLQMYEAGMTRVELPGTSVVDALRSFPRQSSPFLDVLYERNAGHFHSVAAELALSAKTRFSEAGLPIVSAVTRPEPIAQLMQDNYPEAFQVHADVDRINTALQKRGAEFLSFLALGNTVRGFEYTAACRAYVGDSSVYPGSGDVVHLDHMLVSPSMRNSLLGIRIFKELLVRAAEHNVHAAEMLTRESTSYRGFKTGGMLASIIENHWGYRVEDLGVAFTKGEGNQAEKMYRVRIAKG